MNDDLGLVETDALIAELESRFDASMFCGLRDSTESACSHHIRWSGMTHATLGLSLVARQKMLAYIADTAEPDDD